MRDIKKIYVTTGKEMALAIRENAGTDCEIYFGTFVQRFEELPESDKTAVKVWVRDRSEHFYYWCCIGDAEKRGLVKPTSKTGVPFVEIIDDLCKTWEKMPRKLWPKV